MMYVLPKEIDAETKISKNLFLFDLIFIGMVIIIAWLLSSFVYEKIRIIYYINCFVFSLLLRAKSVHNPKKRIITSVYLMLIKDRKIYSRF